MTDHWVMDASPLILLGKSGQLEWLPRMGHLVVPESVATEVAAGSPDDPARFQLKSHRLNESNSEVLFQRQGG